MSANAKFNEIIKEELIKDLKYHGNQSNKREYGRNLQLTQ